MLMFLIMHRQDDAPEEKPWSVHHEEKRTSEIQGGIFALAKGVSEDTRSTKEGERRGRTKLSRGTYVIGRKQGKALP